VIQQMDNGDWYRVPRDWYPEPLDEEEDMYARLDPLRVEELERMPEHDEEAEGWTPPPEMLAWEAECAKRDAAICKELLAHIGHDWKAFVKEEDN